MRTLLLAILVSSACATTSTTTGPVNVAAVRNEINGTIHAEHGERSIHSMGKTSRDRAVVYTTSKDGTKQEETWVKSGDTWRLETSTALTQAAPPVRETSSAR